MPAGERLLQPRTQALIFLALAALWMFARLGQGPLANFDDCYYAEKAKEMVRSGDWLTPHFAGTPRFDNPPLFLWLMAAAFSVAGITSYAAIFFSALSGVLCVVVLLGLARRLGLDPFERWAAGFVLLTTQYFLKFAGRAMFDVFLTLLFLLAVDAYVRAVEGDRKRFLLLGLVGGLGLMTKSILGIFPMAVAALHLLASGRARLLASRWWLAGVGLAALTAAPWYLYSYHVHGPAFFDEHVRWLLWRRAFVIGRERQSWSESLGYLRDLGVTYWPWLPLALAGLALEGRRLAAPGTPAEDERHGPDAWTGRSTAQLLVLWPLVVVGTMSIAIEKKLWYIMPVFPCLALLAARGAGAWIRSDAARRWTIRAGFGLLAAGGMLLNLTPVGAHYARNPDLLRLALVARSTVPEGEAVLNLDLPYWNFANQFLFYSDRNLTEPLADPARVREGLDRGGYALLVAGRHAEVAGGAPAAYPVVAASGRFVLVKAAPAVPAVLPAQDPYP